jgi:hypothetical protein
MNVFCIFTLYLGETCSLHLQGELPCFANMKNYDMTSARCISTRSQAYAQYVLMFALKNWGSKFSVTKMKSKCENQMENKTMSAHL